MANFEPKEFNASDINGGQKFRNGDGISAEAINAPIESALLMQEKVKNIIPEGGTEGQVLTKTEIGTAWKDAPSGGGGSIEGVESTENAIKITKPLEINIEGKEEILPEKYNFDNVDEYVSIGDVSQYVVNGGLYLYIPYLTGRSSNYDGTEVYDSDIQFIPIGSGLSTYDVDYGYDFSLNVGGTASDCYLYCGGYAPYFSDVQIVDKVLGGKATISPSGNADFKLPNASGTLATKEWVRTQVGNSGGSSGGSGGGDYYITAQVVNLFEYYAYPTHYIVLPTDVSKIVLEKVVYMYASNNSTPYATTIDVNANLNEFNYVTIPYLNGVVGENYEWLYDETINVSFEYASGIFSASTYSELDDRLIKTSYFLFRVTP